MFAHKNSHKTNKIHIPYQDYGVILGSSGGRPGLVWSISDVFWVVLGPLWHRFGIALASLWECFSKVFGRMLGQQENIITPNS